LGGEASLATGEYGLAPVFGQCPGVGAMGVTLGGGLGWLSGMFGVCCDNLISVQLATADCQLIDVNTESEPELLWAMRGAAGTSPGQVLDDAISKG
jgi:FAD/FMN-containing dehydrogenase